MSKYTFVYEHTDLFSDRLVTKLTMETQADSLNSILEEFENFLKGAGFVIDGRLDVVNEDFSFDDEDEFNDEETADEEFFESINNPVNQDFQHLETLGSWPYDKKESNK